MTGTISPSYDAGREEITTESASGSTHMDPPGKSSWVKLPGKPVVDLLPDGVLQTGSTRPTFREEFRLTTSVVLVGSSSLLAPQGRPSCPHSPSYFVNHFCGLCWLRLSWESEIPKRLHDYELLAQNGNPDMHPKFVHHIESSLGLVPPKPEERLDRYRLARGRLYREPKKNQEPVTFALWEMMGYQPKLARPLVRTLLGKDELVIAAELGLSLVGVYTANAKGIRYAIRVIRS